MTFDNEFMEDASSTVALPFVMGNSICEARSIEVTRIKLMTGMATVASMVEEKVGDGSKGKSSIDHDLSPTTVPVSDEVDNAMSVGPEPSAASDTSSIAGALNDLLNTDVVFELCVSDPMDVDVVKTFEILASPLAEELRDDVLGISLEYDLVKGASTLEQMEVQETRISAFRSMFLKDCVPLWGCISICGRRPEMEDAVVAVPHFFDIPLWMLIGDCVRDGLIPSKANLPSHFFGVYDGHGGAQVANYCKERIHHALVDELTSWKGCLEGRSGCDWRRQWERVFNDCFVKVDDEVSGIARKGVQCAIDTSDGENSLWSNTMSDPVAPETVGSTAVVSVICSSHIIVANCGDSRAVLCRGKQALPLSMDHKPNREDEHARIEAAGGKVIQWNGYRVFGVLAMSRSIGDRYLKPWIIPEPEVRLIPRAREDECLILASDGLWDVMSNEEICEAARKRLLLWHKKNVAFDSPQKGAGADPASQAAAEYLSKLALQRGSKDNITVVVVDLKPQRKFKSRTSS